MKIKCKSVDEAKKLADRMCYLAWKSAKAVGMGFLQEKGDQPEEAVLKGFTPVERNGQTRYVLDYVHGRMMKLYFQLEGSDVITEPNRRWTADYQSFCHAYPSFQDLARAAAKSLGIEVSYEDLSTVEKVHESAVKGFEAGL